MKKKSRFRSATTLPLAACLLLQFARGSNSQHREGPEFRVETKEVTVPVVVVDKQERVYTQLKKENFRILEDGVPQRIRSFIAANTADDSPLVVMLLLEYDDLLAHLRDEVIQPAGFFVTRVMGPKDFVSLVDFDTRPHVLADFTRNRATLLDALSQLVNGNPAFSESSLYDALKFALAGGLLDDNEYKGMSAVKGRTGILLLCTGLDTLSKTSYDEIQRIVDNSGVPIYVLGIAELAYVRAEPYLSDVQRVTFAEAENVLKTFAQTSGGKYYPVRFEAEVQDDLNQIAVMLHHEYTLTYVSSNPPQAGRKRKIEVLVDRDADGRPDRDLRPQYRRFYVEPKQ
ncbi:MAG: VWA domain-containing protein [Acidobacteriota bacterium]